MRPSANDHLVEEMEASRVVAWADPVGDGLGSTSLASTLTADTDRTDPVKMQRILVVPAISASAAIPLTPMAQAGSFEHFQSPSGNIVCGMTSSDSGASASCEISDHTWVAPPRPVPCEGAWGKRISLHQGGAPKLVCSSDSLRGGDIATLGYGSTWFVDPITCDSEIAGMTCTDGSTGHYFRISRESYELH
jgi:hypothetical protein